MGKTFRILDLQKQHVLDAGFKNVVEKRYKMPVGPWSSDLKLKEVGGWHLLECFEEDSKVHAYTRVCVSLLSNPHPASVNLDRIGRVRPETSSKARWRFETWISGFSRYSPRFETQ